MYAGVGKKDMAGVSGKLGILVNFGFFKVEWEALLFRIAI